MVRKERRDHTKEAIMYDMKHLDKFHALEVHAPAAMKAFLAFDKAAWSDGGDPKKI
jgi:hypothetical protein